MQLKIATDYAIRIVFYLAAQKRMISSKELSEKLGIPQSFVYKITTQLQNENIITHGAGTKGGFELIRKPEDISLYQIIDLMENTTKINRCLEEDEFCSRFATEDCPVRKFYQILQLNIEQHMKEISINDLITQ